MLGLDTRRLTSRLLRRPRSLACAAAAMLAACAPAGRVGTPPRPATSTIVVHNYSGEHTIIYLGRRGTTWRLGEIVGYGEATFPVPKWALADTEDVYLLARRLAGSTFRSDPFPLPTGSTAVWTIEGQPSLSHVALR